MIFGGIQKLTLLDFPGTVSCILFTKGCNFRCPFCHNTSLVLSSSDSPNLKEDEILSFLKKRAGLLDGVCITGGEPLLHPDLADFIRKVKSLGYKVKLDTNGSFPERLKLLINEKLVDYVAMDIKNSFEKYPVTSGVESIDIQSIKDSVFLLSSSTVPHEFRTTVTCELHTVDDIISIAKFIPPSSKYFIQNFVDSGDILSSHNHPVSQSTLQKMTAAAQNIVSNTKFR